MPSQIDLQKKRAAIDKAADEVESFAAALRLWATEVYPGTFEGMTPTIDAADVAEAFNDMQRAVRAALDR